MQLKKLVEKPVEPVPNGMENGDGADDEGNEWQVKKRSKNSIALLWNCLVIEAQMPIFS